MSSGSEGNCAGSSSERINGPFAPFRSRSMLVVVHAGAGYHSTSTESELRAAMRSALQKASASLETCNNPIDAAVEAVRALEDCPLTNAGTGSSMTQAGTVECDACVMDGSSGRFGAVGALTGVKNPVLVAKAVADEYKHMTEQGLMPPLMVVGEGAKKFASQCGIDTESLLTTDRTESQYTKYSKMLLQASGERHEMQKLVSDTVGAICMDKGGAFATAASSGGSWM